MSYCLGSNGGLFLSGYRYVKPIMFSAGIGQMDGEHAVKGEPAVGMWVVKVSRFSLALSLDG